MTNKILLTAIPVVVWFPCWYLYLQLYATIATATAQKLDFNFPENFQGKAYVIDQIHCGQKVIKKGAPEQLNFPENGILLYQGKLEDGYTNHEYYYLSPTQKRIKIPKRAGHIVTDQARTEPNSSEVGLWLEGMGMQAHYPPEDIPGYTFMELIVSSKDSLQKYHDLRYNIQIDSIIHETIKKVPPCH